MAQRGAPTWLPTDARERRPRPSTLLRCLCFPALTDTRHPLTLPPCVSLLQDIWAGSFLSKPAVDPVKRLVAQLQQAAAEGDKAALTQTKFRKILQFVVQYVESEDFSDELRAALEADAVIAS